MRIDIIIRDRQEKGGEGVEATENGKLVEKPEENGVGGGVYKHKT